LKYLIDTSVLSQTVKAKPEQEVLRWLQDADEQSLYISAITIQELRYGLEILPIGGRRHELENWLEDKVLQRFTGRILPVDERVADTCGRLIATGKKSGNIAEIGDALIAATALVHGLQIATLNRKHFARLGVDLVEF